MPALTKARNKKGLVAHAQLYCLFPSPTHSASPPEKVVKVHIWLEKSCPKSHAHTNRLHSTTFVSGSVTVSSYRDTSITQPNMAAGQDCTS